MMKTLDGKKINSCKDRYMKRICFTLAPNWHLLFLLFGEILSGEDRIFQHEILQPVLPTRCHSTLGRTWHRFLPIPDLIPIGKNRGILTRAV